MYKGMIYNENKGRQLEEASNTRIETMVCDILSDKLANVLFTYADKNTGKKFIKEVLKDVVSEIIKEHENHCAKESIERLKNNFDLKSKIDSGHAIHAKFSSIIKELEKKFNANSN